MDESVKVIQTRGLSKRFLGRTVLTDISLCIASGECVAMIGANGSGKTTLLRCLSGVTRPQSGIVLWQGSSDRQSVEVRRLIGYVAHESQLYSRLTLRENLMFAARMCGVATPDARANELLCETELAGHADRLPGCLSRGMRQRLTIARAIIHDPRLLLMDEPFTALDQEGRTWLQQLVQQFVARGHSVCFTTHNPLFSHHLSCRVVCLQNGKLCESMYVTSSGPIAA